jgi:hypothetical protein
MGYIWTTLGCHQLECFLQNNVSDKCQPCQVGGDAPQGAPLEGADGGRRAPLVQLHARWGPRGVGREAVREYLRERVSIDAMRVSSRSIQRNSKNAPLVSPCDVCVLLSLVG